MRGFRFRLVFILTRAKSLWSKALFLWWRLANDRPSPNFGPESWLAPNDYLRDFKCNRRCNWLPRIATPRGYTISWQAINKPCMVDFVMAEVEAPKSFERAIQESIEKVLETFDVVENLSAEQSDTICNLFSARISWRCCRLALGRLCCSSLFLDSVLIDDALQLKTHICHLFKCQCMWSQYDWSKCTSIKKVKAQQERRFSSGLYRLK